MTSHGVGDSSMLMRALFLIFSALSTVAPDAATELEATLVGQHYVSVDEEGRVSIWAETNGVPGLQTAAFEGRERAPAYEADMRVLL